MKSLRPRDLLVLEVIQRHGPLPAPYLYELTKSVAHDRQGLRDRLLALTLAGYVERPPALNHPWVFNDHKVYTLADKGKTALANAGKRNQYATETGGGAPHQLMTAAITANIELGAKNAGYRFISQEEIVSRAPQTTRISNKPLDLPTDIAKDGRRSEKPTEPDQLFGIDYGGSVWFYALEADRGTEQIEAKTFLKNSIQKKLLAYDYILKKGIYKTHLNLPTLRVLFVTTAEDRADNMVHLAGEEFKNGSKNILFKAIPGFNPYFRTPPLMPELFTGEWKRAKYDPITIDKA